MSLFLAPSLPAGATKEFYSTFRWPVGSLSQPASQPASASLFRQSFKGLDVLQAWTVRKKRGMHACNFLPKICLHEAQIGAKSLLKPKVGGKNRKHDPSFSISNRQRSPLARAMLQIAPPILTGYQFPGLADTSGKALPLDSEGCDMRWA